MGESNFIGERHLGEREKMKKGVALTFVALCFRPS